MAELEPIWEAKLADAGWGKQRRSSLDLLVVAARKPDLRGGWLLTLMEGPPRPGTRADELGLLLAQLSSELGEEYALLDPEQFILRRKPARQNEFEEQVNEELQKVPECQGVSARLLPVEEVLVLSGGQAPTEACSSSDGFGEAVKRVASRFGWS